MMMYTMVQKLNQSKRAGKNDWKARLALVVCQSDYNVSSANFRSVHGEFLRTNPSLYCINSCSQQEGDDVCCNSLVFGSNSSGEIAHSYVAPTVAEQS